MLSAADHKVSYEAIFALLAERRKEGEKRLEKATEKLFHVSATPADVAEEKAATQAIQDLEKATAQLQKLQLLASPPTATTTSHSSILSAKHS